MQVMPASNETFETTMGGDPAPDNLVGLEVLDEDTIVKAVELRYKADKIYTLVGDVLLASTATHAPVCWAEWGGACVGVCFHVGFAPASFCVRTWVAGNQASRHGGAWRGVAWRGAVAPPEPTR